MVGDNIQQAVLTFDLTWRITLKPISCKHNTIKKPALEKMSDFFTARVAGYDEHMLTEVKGCKEGYIKELERS